MRDDADFALIYQDEMEIHRHPALTRMWAPVGQQPEVPAPGKNEKKVVYGGVDYSTGQLTYTLADTKCGGSFLAFLVALLLAYARKKIRLVCETAASTRPKPWRPSWKSIANRLRCTGYHRIARA